MDNLLSAVASSLAAALPDGWLLRPEDSGDADNTFLSELYASSRADEMAIVPWTDVEKRAFLQQQFELQRQHYRQHYAEAGFWILECGGCPSGRLYVFDSPSEFRLMDIALLPACRGQGVGGRLIRALLVAGREHDKFVGLHVEPNNPANRLYQRCGFRFVEDRGAYRYLEWHPAVTTTTEALS